MIAHSNSIFSIGLLHRVLLLLLSFQTLGGGALLADIKIGPGKKRDKEMEKRLEQAGAMSPEAKPTQVSFVAGRSVDVELDAATFSLLGLRFVIRDQPKHGVLSDIRPHPTQRHKAIVTYQHREDGELFDRFSYACRLGEGPFSAPAEVILAGRSPQPLLEVERHAQFARVLPGAQVMETFVVVNRGIGPFQNKLEWPAPWVGPSELAVGIGERVEIPVMVRPERPGTLSSELFLQPDNPKSRLRLWIQCEQPFLVSPSRAQMTYSAERGQRYVKTRLMNATEQDIQLKLQLPDRLIGPTEVTLGPKETREVEFALADDDVQGFKGEVDVTDGVLLERLSLGASPEPAQIRLVAPASAVLQFGARDAGTTVKATLVLKNVGGEAAVLAVQAPPPFRVPDDEKSLSVGPGDTRQLAVEVSSDKPGKFDGKVVISGDGNRLELGAEAIFLDPKAAKLKTVAGSVDSPKGLASRPSVVREMEPPPAPEDSQAITSTAPTPEPQPASRQPEAPTHILGMLPPDAAAALSYVSVFGLPPEAGEISGKYSAKLEPLEVIKRTRTELEVLWPIPNPESPPKDYRVEAARQVYEPVTKMFFRSWSPISGVERLMPADGKEGIRLSGLMAGAQYELRFMAVDDKNKTSPPSDVLIVTMVPPWRMTMGMWLLLGFLVLGLLMITARRLYLRRMGLSFA